MSNITTDINSFENIDYPKNIYELLLNLKNQPLQINCNSGNPSDVSNYQKYNSEETLLRVDPVFGEIYTKTFFTELYIDYEITIPPFFVINEDLFDLDINNLLDFSAKLTDVKSIIINENGTDKLIDFKRFYDLSSSIYIDSNHAFLTIPTDYDIYDDSVITNKIPDERKRLFQFYLTLVYTKKII